MIGKKKGNTFFFSTANSSKENGITVLEGEEEIEENGTQRINDVSYLVHRIDISMASKKFCNDFSHSIRTSITQCCFSVLIGISSINLDLKSADERYYFVLNFQINCSVFQETKCGFFMITLGCCDQGGHLFHPNIIHTGIEF